MKTDLAEALRRQGRHADAALAFARAAVGTSGPAAAECRYQQAVEWAAAGEVVRALRALEKAVGLGGAAVADRARLDPSLAPLRGPSGCGGPGNPKTTA